MGAAGEGRAGTKLSWAGINAHVQEWQNSLDDKTSFQGDLQGMPRAVCIPESCPSLMEVHNKSSSACLDLSLPSLFQTQKKEDSSLEHSPGLGVQHEPPD